MDAYYYRVSRGHSQQENFWITNYFGDKIINKVKIKSVYNFNTEPFKMESRCKQGEAGHLRAMLMVGTV